MTAYITKIPEFNRENIKTRTAGKWFENLIISFNDWTAFKTAFLEQFTNNNTSITLQNCFCNIKQKPSKSVMTYIGKFNKLLRQIHQLETNDYYSDAQILDQFITGLKDKLIKKICPHAPENLNSAIQHAIRYEMAMEETNPTKLSKTISPTNNNSNLKDINHPKDRIKTTSYHLLITSLRIAITLQQDQQNRSNQRYSLPQQSYYQPPLPPAYYPLRLQYQTDYYQPAPQPMQQQLVQQNQFAPQNRFATNNNRINPNNQLVPRNPAQPRLTYYHTQPSYLTIPEEQDFYHTALSESRAVAQQQNPFYTLTTIPPFEANESPFLLSNAVTNKQKAITAMYTEAEVKGKAIRLILDTNAKLDWETQELQLFYQRQHARVPATCDIFNKQSEKALVFEFEEKEEKPIVETFMALESTSNWAEETEQTYFAKNSYSEKPETPGWNIPYSKPEPKKRHPYIPLKCKDCHKKLSSMEACISPEEKYENHTCYYCKACHRE
ncbi:hypothetical protein G9A89_011261 [Geosiphon pyriformis]|nr:hypothetical protein G9A89_011261 [Geosiphon pyriformis]